jgi:four helix bundle protein
MIKSFRDMQVWKNAMDIAVTIHAQTETLPRKEDYGFVSQIRRSALSISANCAEAFGRYHTLDKINMYYYARSSACETQSHLEYGKRVGYISEEISKKLILQLDDIILALNRVILKLR